MTARNEAESRLRPVTSRQNALVKDLRKAFSQGEPTGEGYIAVEGLRIVEEAIRSRLLSASPKAGPSLGTVV